MPDFITDFKEIDPLEEVDDSLPLVDRIILVSQDTARSKNIRLPHIGFIADIVDSCTLEDCNRLLSCVCDLCYSNDKEIMEALPTQLANLARVLLRVESGTVALSRIESSLLPCLRYFILDANVNLQPFAIDAIIATCGEVMLHVMSSKLNNDDAFNSLCESLWSFVKVLLDSKQTRHVYTSTPPIAVAVLSCLRINPRWSNAVGSVAAILEILSKDKEIDMQMKLSQALLLWPSHTRDGMKFHSQFDGLLPDSMGSIVGIGNLVETTVSERLTRSIQNGTYISCSSSSCLGSIGHSHTHLFSSDDSAAHDKIIGVALRIFDSIIVDNPSDKNFLLSCSIQISICSSIPSLVSDASLCTIADRISPYLPSLLDHPESMIASRSYQTSGQLIALLAPCVDGVHFYLSHDESLESSDLLPRDRRTLSTLSHTLSHLLQMYQSMSQGNVMETRRVTRSKRHHLKKAKKNRTLNWRHSLTMQKDKLQEELEKEKQIDSGRSLGSQKRGPLVEKRVDYFTDSSAWNGDYESDSINSRKSRSLISSDFPNSPRKKTVIENQPFRRGPSELSLTSVESFGGSSSDEDDFVIRNSVKKSDSPISSLSKAVKAASLAQGRVLRRDIACRSDSDGDADSDVELNIDLDLDLDAVDVESYDSGSTGPILSPHAAAAVSSRDKGSVNSDSDGSGFDNGSASGLDSVSPVVEFIPTSPPHPSVIDATLSSDALGKMVAVNKNSGFSIDPPFVPSSRKKNVVDGPVNKVEEAFGFSVRSNTNANTNMTKSTTKAEAFPLSSFGGTISPLQQGVGSVTPETSSNAQLTSLSISPPAISGVSQTQSIIRGELANLVPCLSQDLDLEITLPALAAAEECGATPLLPSPEAERPSSLSEDVVPSKETNPFRFGAPRPVVHSLSLPRNFRIPDSLGSEAVVDVGLIQTRPGRTPSLSTVGEESNLLFSPRSIERVGGLDPDLESLGPEALQLALSRQISDITGSSMLPIARTDSSGSSVAQNSIAPFNRIQTDDAVVVASTSASQTVKDSSSIIPVVDTSDVAQTTNALTIPPSRPMKPSLTLSLSSSSDEDSSHEEWAERDISEHVWQGHEASPRRESLKSALSLDVGFDSDDTEDSDSEEGDIRTDAAVGPVVSLPPPLPPSRTSSSAEKKKEKNRISNEKADLESSLPTEGPPPTQPTGVELDEFIRRMRRQQKEEDKRLSSEVNSNAGSVAATSINSSSLTDNEGLARPSKDDEEWNEDDSDSSSTSSLSSDEMDRFMPTEVGRLRPAEIADMRIKAVVSTLPAVVTALLSLARPEIQNSLLKAQSSSLNHEKKATGLEEGSFVEDSAPISFVYQLLSRRLRYLVRILHSLYVYCRTPSSLMQLYSGFDSISSGLLFASSAMHKLHIAHPSLPVPPKELSCAALSDILAALISRGLSPLPSSSGDTADTPPSNEQDPPEELVAAAMGAAEPLFALFSTQTAVRLVKRAILAAKVPTPGVQDPTLVGVRLSLALSNSAGSIAQLRPTNVSTDESEMLDSSASNIPPNLKSHTSKTRLSFNLSSEDAIADSAGLMTSSRAGSPKKFTKTSNGQGPENSAVSSENPVDVTNPEPLSQKAENQTKPSSSNVGHDVGQWRVRQALAHLLCHATPKLPLQTLRGLVSPTVLCLCSDTVSDVRSAAAESLAVLLTSLSMFATADSLESIPRTHRHHSSVHSSTSNAAKRNVGYQSGYSSGCDSACNSAYNSEDRSGSDRRNRTPTPLSSPTPRSLSTSRSPSSSSAIRHTTADPRITKDSKEINQGGLIHSSSDIELSIDNSISIPSQNVSVAAKQPYRAPGVDKPKLPEGLRELLDPPSLQSLPSSSGFFSGAASGVSSPSPFILSTTSRSSKQGLRFDFHSEDATESEVFQFPVPFPLAGSTPIASPLSSAHAPLGTHIAENAPRSSRRSSLTNVAYSSTQSQASPLESPSLLNSGTGNRQGPAEEPFYSTAGTGVSGAVAELRKVFRALRGEPVLDCSNTEIGSHGVQLWESNPTADGVQLSCGLPPRAVPSDDLNATDISLRFIKHFLAHNKHIFVKNFDSEPDGVSPAGNNPSLTSTKTIATRPSTSFLSPVLSFMATEAASTAALILHSLIAATGTVQERAHPQSVHTVTLGSPSPSPSPFVIGARSNERSSLDYSTTHKHQSNLSFFANGPAAVSQQEKPLQMDSIVFEDILTRNRSRSHFNDIRKDSTSTALSTPPLIVGGETHFSDFINVDALVTGGSGESVEESGENIDHSSISVKSTNSLHHTHNHINSHSHNSSHPHIHSHNHIHSHSSNCNTGSTSIQIGRPPLPISSVQHSQSHLSHTYPHPTRSHSPLSVSMTHMKTLSEPLSKTLPTSLPTYCSCSNSRTDDRLPCSLCSAESALKGSTLASTSHLHRGSMDSGNEGGVHKFWRSSHFSSSSGQFTPTVAAAKQGLGVVPALAAALLALERDVAMCSLRSSRLVFLRLCECLWKGGDDLRGIWDILMVNNIENEPDTSICVPEPIKNALEDVFEDEGLKSLLVAIFAILDDIPQDPIASGNKKERVDLCRGLFPQPEAVTVFESSSNAPGIRTPYLKKLSSFEPILNLPPKILCPPIGDALANMQMYRYMTDFSSLSRKRNKENVHNGAGREFSALPVYFQRIPEALRVAHESAPSFEVLSGLSVLEAKIQRIARALTFSKFWQSLEVPLSRLLKYFRPGAPDWMRVSALLPPEITDLAESEWSVVRMKEGLDMHLVEQLRRRNIKEIQSSDESTELKISRFAVPHPSFAVNQKKKKKNNSNQTSLDTSKLSLDHSSASRGEIVLSDAVDEKNIAVNSSVDSFGKIQNDNFSLPDFPVVDTTN